LIVVAHELVFCARSFQETRITLRIMLLSAE